ncbi:MAG TPA: ornithine carbamoyltransferase [Actinomycetes bacterium]|nr:ornithine carbamoyltransferase [Actinomycetes bacterium]
MSESVDLKNRDFLKEFDFTRDEMQYLLDLSRDVKAAKKSGTEQQALRGKSIALIFEKTSTRTRCAFEVAAFDQGANTTYLDPTSSQIGHKESAADTARVLCRMFDGIEFRGKEQATVEELAEYSDVPVFNGLTDEWHPTQMLADFLTMYEHSNKAPSDMSYCFMGDGRFNMGRSLLAMGAVMGSDVRICAPTELWPDAELRDAAAARAEQSGGKITMTEDPAEGLAGVEFVHTDVWVSMGEPREVWEHRVKTLMPYQVNTAAMQLTGNADAKFMHCLPAYHDENTGVGRDIAELTGVTGGLEVSDEVFRSPANVAFDQAENRMHTIKAVLIATMA